MTSICWKSAVTWSLLGLMFLLFILMVGPLPALAGQPDAVLYEVTEDMYLKDGAGKPGGQRRPGRPPDRGSPAFRLGEGRYAALPLVRAVDQPQGQEVHRERHAALTTSAWTTGKGTLAGTYAVVVQGDNETDAPEFVILTGTFTGDGGPLTVAEPVRRRLGSSPTVSGRSTAARATFKFTGTFRLPFALD